MQVLHTKKEIQDFSQLHRQEGKSIGFVPTMGALHAGHIQLVKQSVSENQITVSSIFVNPIQFNNPSDLEKYPRTLDADLEMLKSAGCDAVFVPTVEEMYPEPDNSEFDFGNLDKVMEGKFRPGHFRGVGVVVKKFFEFVLPHKAYFGEKDFQQLAVIKHMVNSLSIPVEIIPCATVREADGLAMSSRNTRLTKEERAIAPEIYFALQKAKENYSWFSPDGLGKMLIGELEQNPLFRVEYAEIADADSLMPFADWDDTEHAVICVAVFLGEVRLIDNIRLY